MRILPILLLLIAAAPAQAEYWTSYSNTRFGYEIDVPPGFEGSGETATGEGQGFYLPEAEQMLSVWGGPLAGDLESEAGRLIAEATMLGWAMTSQSLTPEWSAFSARRGSSSFLQRMILLCDRKTYATMRLDFPAADINALEPVIQGLARSFRAKTC